MSVAFAMTMPTNPRMKRTDIHRPAEMKPADYVAVAVIFPDEYEDLETGNMVKDRAIDVIDRDVWERYETGKIGHWAGTKNRNTCCADRCDHCGANCKYGVYMLHTPSNEMIFVGRTCSGNRFSDKDWENFKVKARVRSHRKNALEALRANGHPEIADWFEGRTRLSPMEWRRDYQGDGYHVEPCHEDPDWRASSGKFSLWEQIDAINEQMCRDYPGRIPFEVKKAVNARIDNMRRVARAEASAYGLLRHYSEAQLGEETLPESFFIAAIDKVEDAIHAMVPEPVPLTDKKPVPAGRVTVKGTVVGVKYVDGFGPYSPDIKKIIVETADGWKAYGTAPCERGERGEEIEFTATLQPSDDDAYFGFFSRPTLKKEVRS